MCSPKSYGILNQIVGQIAESLKKASNPDEWIAIWRLRNGVEMPSSAQVRQMGLLPTETAPPSEDAIKEILLDAAVALLVEAGRAERRIAGEVEEVRFLQSKTPPPGQGGEAKSGAGGAFSKEKAAGRKVTRMVKNG